MSKVDTTTSHSGLKPISLSGIIKYLWAFLPSGGSLPADVWQNRHRFLLGLTWFHSLLIALIGPVLGYSWELSFEALFNDGTVLHTVGEGFAVALFAGIAGWGTNRRLIKATAVGFGLMSASAILVHLSGGYIEFHFHFFVMVAFLALYQDWVPYLLAIVYVAIHHGVLGALWPQEVYNHTAAINAPWTWAGIHAFFVLWAAVGSVIAWRFTETAVAQTKLILEATGEGIFGLDLEGNITFINPAAAKMLGVDQAWIVGKPVEMVQANSTDMSLTEVLSSILAPNKDGIAHYSSEVMFRRQDGTVFPADYVSTPIVDRGEISGLVIAFRDVTTRKQVEQALAKNADDLARSNAELQHFAAEIRLGKEKLERVNSTLTVQAAELVRSNTELQNFAYVASHDLQEPLRMVASYVQLLARRYKGKLDSEADEFIDYVVDGSARMQALINALLTYSRIGTTGKPFERTDCEKLFGTTIKNLQMAIEDSRAVVTHDPLPTVMGDATQLAQLLQNLISNAIKFRGAKPPTVHVSAQRNGKDWYFSCRDDGIGVDPQFAERIFVIFQRLHSNEEYPGTGIGLALCKKIVERHGGRIWLESEPGKGATFRFTIPV